MGMFDRIKEFFNKNIECGSEIDSHIVFPFTKKKYVYLSKNILVRDNTACVIVYKHKVCDVLIPGKYKVSEDNLPNTFYKAKVNKLKKRGRKLKKIKVDIYFVNTKEFKSFEFKSDEPFVVKSSEMGKMRGLLKGKCNIRVIDPERLLKALIAETGKAKLEEIHEDIGLWIGNKINKTIEKQKVNTNLILTEQEHTQNLLNTYLEDGYDNIGLFVKNIKLKAVDFPKKYQKKANEYISKHTKPVKLYNINSSINSSVANNSYSSQSDNMAKVTIERGGSAMQRPQNLSNISSFKVCSRCGVNNGASAKICRNCGNQI